MDAWVKDAIINKAYSLKETLYSLRSKEYNSEAPKELIDDLLDIIDAVIKYYEELSQSASDRQVLRISQFLARLNAFLDDIKTVEISDIPVELLPILERIMKKYDKDSLIYLKPTKDYNYYYNNNVNSICDLAEEAFGYKKETRRGIATISFPLTEKNNVMLHCIFSHEIGHHFGRKFSITNNIIPKIQIDKESLDELVDRIFKEWAKTKKEINGKDIGLDSFFEIEAIRTQQIEESLKILSKWLNELISDAIAACLLGPAYFFSLVELGSSLFTQTYYSDRHPPLFIRIDTVLRILKDLGYFTITEEYLEINSTIQTHREISDNLFGKDETNLHLRLLKKSIGPAIPVLIDEVKKFFGPSDDLDEINKEIKYLIKLLKHLIPPNEIIIYSEERSYPANPIAILNACWIVRLEYMSDIYELLGSKTLEEKYNALTLLNMHTLKALELSEIHKNLMEGILRASSQKSR